jgi:hypothetical protein
MKIIDPKSFGDLCEKYKLSSGPKNVEALCQDFARDMAPTIDTGAVNKPPDMPCGTIYFRSHGALDGDDAVAVLEKKANPITTGDAKPVVVAIAGEDHGEKKDQRRAYELIDRFFAQKHADHALIYFERGLLHKHAKSYTFTSEKMGKVVDEWVILGESGSEVHRSVIAAAYCVACLAGGDQSKKGKVLILFGDNHVDDVVKAFTILMGPESPFPWLSSRPRAIHVLRTQS